MKKWLAAMLIGMLMWTATAGAEKMAKGEWKGNTVFTVSYDEKRYQLDTEEWKDENSDVTRYQFTLYDETCFVTCFIDYYEEMAWFSSYLATEAEMVAYIAETMQAFEGVKTEICEVYPVTVQKGAKKAMLPFLILRSEQDGETYYQAELVSHGHSIMFSCGAQRRGTEDKTLLKTLKAFLDTFMPVTE